MTWENTPYELQRTGCLCYHDGKNRCTPDACPVHGWRPNATPEMLEECRIFRAKHEASTLAYIKRATAVAVIRHENAKEAIYREALAKWGVEAQTYQAVEEFGELLTVISHHRRGRATCLQVCGEIADAQIMLEQLALIYGPAMVAKCKVENLARLERRIEEGE